MSRDEYIDAVAHIRATETFKRDTIEKMRKEARTMLKNDFKLEDNTDREEYIVDNDDSLRRQRYGRWAFAAVFLVLVLAIAFIVPNILIPPIGPSSALPAFELGDDYEGYTEMMTDPVDETLVKMWEQDSLWTEDAALDTLPVVRYVEPPETERLDRAQRIARAQEIAKAVGVENVEVTDNTAIDIKEKYYPLLGESTRTYYPNINSNYIEIQVDCFGNFSASMFSVPLPEGLRYDPHNLTKEEGNKIIDYLLDQYNEFFGFTSPVPYVTEVYGSNDLPYKVLGAYEGAEPLADHMLSRYKRVNGYANFGVYDNELKDMYYSKQTTQKIGDYPIITAEEAPDLYKAGIYFGSGSSHDIDLQDKEIVNTKLSYLGFMDIIMPAYTILVEGEPSDDGAKQYHTFYIPAVKSEYISNWSSFMGAGE